MKKDFRKRTVLFALCVALIFECALGTRADSALSFDYKYYTVSLEDVQKTIPSIVNDGNWRSWISVAMAEKGISVSWKAAVKNVRVASPLQISLDGAHAVFSDLKVGAGGCQLGFSFSSRAAYGDYITNLSANPLAALPLVMALNTKDGTVTCYAAKALTPDNSGIISKVVCQSEQLKTENLVGKEFGLSFEIISGSSEADYIWRVTLAGETFTLPHTVLFDATTGLDFSACYMTVNAWNEKGTNTMSLNWQSLHGGALTCADKPESKPLLDGADTLIRRIASIVAVTPSSGKEIGSIRKAYNTMPESQKFFIENYSHFVQIENAYKVVEKIAAMKSPATDSSEAFAQIDECYASLTDDEKVLVTNYADYIKLKKNYFKLLMRNLYQTEFFTVNTLTEDPTMLRQDETIYETVDTIIDVDGGTKTKTITNHINVLGKDGTQYLWIPILLASVLLCGMAAWFLTVLIKRKKAGK